jgi:uncharacterized protein
VFDGHTHYLRDDTRLVQFVKMRKQVAALGWNPALKASRRSRTSSTTTT